MKDLEKFIHNNDWEIFTPNGWQDFKGIAKLKKRNVYLVTTETGKSTICSGGHSFIGKNNQKVLCRNSKNRIIKTSDGLEKVISIKRHSKSHVFDIVDVKNGNVFFGNGILHHNTHILEEFWASVIPSISSGKTSKILMVSCVTADTHVYTSKGIQLVGDLVNKNKLGAYEVPEYKVLGKHHVRSGTLLFNNGTQKTLTIKTPHSVLECSHEHKLWSYKQGVFGWHKSSELSVGDYVALQGGMRIWGNNDCVKEFCPRKISKNKNVWIPQVLNADIAYFLGLFIAEGSAYKRHLDGSFVGGTVTITCGDPSIVGCLSRLGLPVGTDKSGLRHTISSLHLIEFLQYLGFDLSLKAPHKYIPPRLLQMSEPNIIALLQGMFDGDGCCSAYKGKVYLMSSSKRLIEQTRVILQNFGIYSTIYTKTQKPTKLVSVSSIQHTLECGETESQKFIQQIGFRIKRKQEQGLKHHNNKTRKNPRDVVPGSVKFLKEGILERGVAYHFKKLGISLASFYLPNRLNSSRDVLLRIKEKLKAKKITPELSQFLEDNVCKNTRWDAITDITEGINEVYDFSLPDTKDDDWCHSVIYNGYIGHQTPNGVGNKFYEIFSGAENGSIPEWKASRIDWWDVPGRDEEWKKSMVAVLGSEEKFSQEFGNTFLDNNTCAVGALIIEQFKREKVPPVWTSEDGEYVVFEFPDKDRLYVIGVDVGEGIGRAASVAQILDVTDLQDIKQVAVYSSATVEPYHFANKLNTIGHSWGAAPMLIERNNCGAQVIDALHYKHSYEKIVSYNKISDSEKYNRTRNMGVLSHNNIRFDGVQNMRYWINHLRCVRINDPSTISEFETFVRQPNGVFKKRTENFFDDRIMSLVWALFILEPEICEQYFSIEDYDNQHKPSRIRSNGYWETENRDYELKDLKRDSNVIQKPSDNSLGVTESDLFEMDKYELDVESLQDMGYNFFNPDV